MYIDIIRHIWNEVRRKRREKWRTNRLFIHYDNAPAHRSVSVKDFLAKNNVTTLKRTPYLPDKSPPGFYLSLYWNQHWRDSAFVMLLTWLRIRWMSWKGFYRMASRTVSITLTDAGRNVSLYKGAILKEM